MNPYSISKLPKDVQLELAERIKKIRKQHKLSQKVLAEKSTVSLGSLKRFENTGEISLSSLLKIATILHRLDEFDQLFVVDNLDEVKKLFSAKMRRK